MIYDFGIWNSLTHSIEIDAMEGSVSMDELDDPEFAAEQMELLYESIVFIISLLLMLTDF